MIIRRMDNGMFGLFACGGADRFCDDVEAASPDELIQIANAYDCTVYAIDDCGDITYL